MYDILNSTLTDEVTAKVSKAKDAVDKNMDNIEFTESLSDQRNSKGAVFQIRASDCVASVIFIVGKYYSTPEVCIEQAVSLGGDTDTIASMVGAAMGALHGSSWIPTRWFKNIENSVTHGRDVLIKCALELSEFEFTSSASVIIEGE